MLLLLKLVLVPSLIAAVTLASRRWGLRIGGILTGLPMVAGPTLCFYAIEQGNAFAAGAARSAMLGVIATGAFCLVYARTAAHAGWPLSVLAGWGAFAVGALATNGMRELGGIGEFALASIALAGARRLVPVPPVLAEAGAAPPRWDLLLRMLASAAAVILFTAVAGLLGPRLSGILSAFPVVTLILAVFTHVQREGASVALFLRAVLRGLHGFALFCLVLSTALGPVRWNLLSAVSLALAAQVALQTFLVWRVSAAPRGTTA